MYHSGSAMYRLKCAFVVAALAMMSTIGGSSNQQKSALQEQGKNEEALQKEQDALLEAVKKGNYNAAVALYKQRLHNRELDNFSTALEEVVQRIGSHPLSLAAFFGDYEVIKALLARYIPVDSRDQQDNTPLVWACACDGNSCKKLFTRATCYHADCVDLLIKSGATVTGVTGYGSSLLDFVISNKNPRSIKHLCDAHARSDRSSGIVLPTFIWAASKNMIEVVYYMLQEQLCKVNEVDNNADTALHWAVKNNQNALVQLLLDFQASVLQENKRKETALTLAVAANDPLLVISLAQKAAEQDNEKNNHWSALSWAAYRGYADVVSSIIKQEVEIDEQDDGGNTALHWAIRGNQVAVAQMLLAHHADHTIMNKESWNPFGLACKQGNADMVHCIAQAGIDDLDAHNKYGLSPLALAARYGNKDTMVILLQNSVAVDTVDAAGNTALFWACRFGHLDAAQLLINAGADINKKNNYGFTPLYWAVEGNYIKVARLLLNSGAHIGEKLPYTKSAKYLLALAYARATNAIKNKCTFSK